MRAKNPICRTWFLQLDFSKIKYISKGGKNRQGRWNLLFVILDKYSNNLIRKFFLKQSIFHFAVGRYDMYSKIICLSTFCKYINWGKRGGGTSHYMPPSFLSVPTALSCYDYMYKEIDISRLGVSPNFRSQRCLA